MPDCQRVADELRQVWPGAIIKMIDGVTEGQACTALIGLDALQEVQAEIPEPVTIGACDNGALYDSAAFRVLADDPDVDVIVWGVRGYPNAWRYPKMFGWINAENEHILSISVKTPLSAPDTDPIVLGTFTFRRADDFRRAVSRLMARDGRVNGEFYIDSCINDAIELGLKCRLFVVDSYLCWGAPNDLRTYEYWQSCFHKWNGHPYRLELDHRVPADQVAILDANYRAWRPDLPGTHE